MASEGRASEEVDIVGHILDHDYLEVPFWNANHFFDGKISLPQFAPIDVFGVAVDLSISRHVVMMWVASALLIVFLNFAFRRSVLVPSGLANLFEALVVFIRDEVVVPIMGEHGKVYLPYLLTVFFFILFCNLLGLIPYTATATGNISVTAALALMTFFVTQGAGIANNGFFGYLRSIVPPGLPAPLLIIMIPIELISLLAKPFALCIRLFANMIAGHVAIMVFLGLVIMMKTLWLAPFSVTFAVALYLLEIFIGFIQAFIFTLLSAMFINMAAHPEH
jgi:F-type H+-transporting ATPase subunit a